MLLLRIKYHSVVTETILNLIEQEIVTVMYYMKRNFHLHPILWRLIFNLLLAYNTTSLFDEQCSEMYRSLQVATSNQSAYLSHAWRKQCSGDSYAYSCN